MMRSWVCTKTKPWQQLLLELSRRYHSDCISQQIWAWIKKKLTFIFENKHNFV